MAADAEMDYETELFEEVIEYEDEEESLVGYDETPLQQQKQAGSAGMVSDEESYYSIEEEYEDTEDTSHSGSSSSEDCDSSVHGEDGEEEEEEEDNTYEADEQGAFVLALTDLSSMDEISSLEHSEAEARDSDSDVSYIVEEVMYMDAAEEGQAAGFAQGAGGGDAAANDTYQKWNQMHQSEDWSADDVDFLELEVGDDGFFSTYEEMLVEESDEEEEEEEQPFTFSADTETGGDDDQDHDDEEDADEDDEEEDDDDDSVVPMDEAMIDAGISTPETQAATEAPPQPIPMDDTDMPVTTDKAAQSVKASPDKVKEKSHSEASGSKKKSSKKDKSSKSSKKSKSKKKKSKKSKRKGESTNTVEEEDDDDDDDDDDTAQEAVEHDISMMLAASMHGTDAPAPSASKRPKPIFQSRKRIRPKPSEDRPLDESESADMFLDVAATPSSEDDTLQFEETFGVPFTMAKTQPSKSFEKMESDNFFAGREKELDQLKTSLRRIKAPPYQNPGEAVYITGPPGVGKTALVEEFYAHLPVDVMFCYGSFDEAKHKSKALSGLIDCLTMLVDNLLSDYEVDEWKERLSTTLGGNALLLCRIIPNLRVLLGIDDKQDKVKQGFDITTQRRFDRLRYSIRAFLVTVCAHVPVVMILDDAHFAGGDSLHVMGTFLATKALKNFALVCCHRPIKNTHQLSVFKNRLRELPTTRILLKNLDQKDTTRLLVSRLQDLLNVESIDNKSKKLNSLSSALFSTTSGSPLLLVQTIAFLVEVGIIKPSDSSSHFSCKTESVKDESLVPTTATKVVERRLKDLSKELLLILKSAALLGLSQFSVHTLIHFVKPLFEITRKRKDKIPVPTLSIVMKLLDICENKRFLKRLSHNAFAFSHDVVKKCANNLFPLKTKNKMKLHFRLGSDLSRLGLASSGSQLDVQEMFKLLAMDQLNEASSQMNNSKDRAQLAKLNLDLSDLSMSKGAFLAALEKADAGLGFMDETVMWSENYELTMRMMLSKARLQFCTRAPPSETIEVAEMILANATSERDKLGAYQVLIFDLIERNILNGAHAKNVEVLAELDEILPTDVNTAVGEELAAIDKMLMDKTNADLCTLPKMTHRKTISKMTFLAQLSEVSRLRGNLLYETLAATRMMKLTIQYGSCHVTALAFSLYAVARARRNMHGVAFRFGRIAETIAKSDNLYGGNALVHHYWEVNHWRRSYGQSADALAKVSGFTAEVASTEQLAFHVGAYLSNILVSGAHHLGAAEVQAVQFQQLMFDWRIKETWRVLVPYQFILDLMGNADDFRFEYEQRVKKWNETSNAKALQYLNFIRMLSEFTFGDFIEAGIMRRRLIGWRPDGVWRPYLALVDCMLALYQAKRATGKEQIRQLDRADVILKYIEKLAAEGCVNCASIGTLMHAECFLARHKKGLSAMKVRSLYDPAISCAGKHGLLFQQALANEMAGRFFVNVRDEAWAAAYLTEAWYLYNQWGAVGKCEQLQDEFGTYLDCNLPPKVYQGQVRRTRRPRIAMGGPGRLPPPPQMMNPQQRPGGPPVPLNQQGVTIPMNPNQQPHAGPRTSGSQPPPNPNDPNQPSPMENQTQHVPPQMLPNQRPDTMQGNPGPPMGGRPNVGVPLNMGPAGPTMGANARSHRALRPSAPGVKINARVQPSSTVQKRMSFRDLAMNAEKKGRSHRLKKPELSAEPEVGGGGGGFLSNKLNAMKQKDKKKSRWKRRKKKGKDKDKDAQQDDIPPTTNAAVVQRRSRSQSNEDFVAAFSGVEDSPDYKAASWRGQSGHTPNLQAQRRNSAENDTDLEPQKSSSRLKKFRKAMPWTGKADAHQKLENTGHSRGSKKKTPTKLKGTKKEILDASNSGGASQDGFDEDAHSEEGSLAEITPQPKSLRQKILGKKKSKDKIGGDRASPRASPSGKKKMKASLLASLNSRLPESTGMNDKNESVVSGDTASAGEDTGTNHSSNNMLAISSSQHSVLSTESEAKSGSGDGRKKKKKATKKKKKSKGDHLAHSDHSFVSGESDIEEKPSRKSKGGRKVGTSRSPKSSRVSTVVGGRDLPTIALDGELDQVLPPGSKKKVGKRKSGTKNKKKKDSSLAADSFDSGEDVRSTDDEGELGSLLANTLASDDHDDQFNRAYLSPSKPSSMRKSLMTSLSWKPSPGGSLHASAHKKGKKKGKHDDNESVDSFGEDLSPRRPASMRQGFLKHSDSWEDEEEGAPTKPQSLRELGSRSEHRNSPATPKKSKKSFVGKLFRKKKSKEKEKE